METKYIHKQYVHYIRWMAMKIVGNGKYAKKKKEKLTEKLLPACTMLHYACNQICTECARRQQLQQLPLPSNLKRIQRCEAQVIWQNTRISLRIVFFFLRSSQTYWLFDRNCTMKSVVRKAKTQNNKNKNICRNKIFKTKNEIIVCEETRFPHHTSVAFAYLRIRKHICCGHKQMPALRLILIGSRSLRKTAQQNNSRNSSSCNNTVNFLASFAAAVQRCVHIYSVYAAKSQEKIWTHVRVPVSIYYHLWILFGVTVRHFG